MALYIDSNGKELLQNKKLQKEKKQRLKALAYIKL